MIMHKGKMGMDIGKTGTDIGKTGIYFTALLCTLRKANIHFPRIVNSIPDAGNQ